MLNQTTTPPASSGLIRILGLGFGLAVIVGSTLGIGILRTPGLVAGQLPTASGILIVWIAGGLYTLLGAVCIAELGTMLPQAGGYYVYARRAFGDAVGFASAGPTGSPTARFLATSRSGSASSRRCCCPRSRSREGHRDRHARGAGRAAVAGLRASSRFQEVATAVKCAAFLA